VVTIATIVSSDFVEQVMYYKWEQLSCFVGKPLITVVLECNAI
jgi:hypothetical protein